MIVAQGAEGYARYRVTAVEEDGTAITVRAERADA
jgi:hypothetical protein